MKRFVLVLTLLLMLSETLTAGPVHWVKTLAKKRIVRDGLILTGASIFQWKAADYCRRGDIDRCTPGYGSAHAADWLSIGTGTLFLGLSYACRKDEAGKICDGFAYAVPVYLTAAGIHDFTRYKPQDQK